MANDEDEAFRYISYATLREAWSEVRGFFIAWLILSVISIGFGLLFDFGVDATEPIWSEIPKPLLYILGFAGFTWIVRGEKFNFVFPKSFKLWLISTVVFAAIVLAASISPIWVMMPVYLGLIFVFSLMDSLDRIGKENFERLNLKDGNSKPPVDEEEFDEV